MDTIKNKGNGGLGLENCCTALDYFKYVIINSNYYQLHKLFNSYVVTA